MLLCLEKCFFFAFEFQGRFIPSCDEDGFYRKLQCDRGECWCVDQNGGEVAGTRVRGKTDCGEVADLQKRHFTIFTCKMCCSSDHKHPPNTHTHADKASFM